MGVDLEELRHAVENNEPAAEVLELTRRQHWCAPGSAVPRRTSFGGRPFTKSS